jgi:Na+-transporting NADH:ubiquinone oxidoreductase subunit A
MANVIKIRRGFDIKLLGEAERVMANAPQAETVAVKPTDFIGVIPRMLVETGHEVKAGTALFHDKSNEQLVFTSPVSGEVVEIRRGAKRKLLEVVILADKETEYIDFGKADPGSLTRGDIIDKMMKSGVWPVLRQRPYKVIADPEDEPKAIFISAFDSAPLAPDIDYMVHGQARDFQTGIDVLKKLTPGKVYLNIRNNAPVSEVFTNARGVQINKFEGPHPAGCVGIQIHHIDPIGKNENVWVINPLDVLVTGRLFNEGRYNATRIIALAGSEVKNPKYYKTIAGSSIKPIIADNIHAGNNRYISGNVLNGSKISNEGYLGFYDNMITVIPEGDEPEFLGWIAPGLDKVSLSRTFFSWLMPHKKYRLNTNMHGEERAFVMTGQYEKVLPMDIYPMQLLKAILVGDIEAMENLGIYEVDEEEFALCEFICTSKMPVQRIIRQGLDLTRAETA